MRRDQCGPHERHDGDSVHVRAADPTEMNRHECNRQSGCTEADHQQAKEPDDTCCFSKARAIHTKEQQLDQDAVHQEQPEGRSGVRDKTHVGIERGERRPRPESDPDRAANDFTVAGRIEARQCLGGDSQRAAGRVSDMSCH